MSIFPTPEKIRRPTLKRRHGSEGSRVPRREGASLGDPLADVAVTRLDLLWAFGEAAMHSFTDRYRELTRIDWKNLARWELWAALRPMSRLAVWAPPYAEAPLSRPDITEASMQRGHRRFVEQALASLTR